MEIMAGIGMESAMINGGSNWWTSTSMECRACAGRCMHTEQGFKIHKRIRWPIIKEPGLKKGKRFSLPN